MTIFHYKSRNKDKVLVEGSCEYPTLEEAIRFLTSQGLTLIDIESEEEKRQLKSLANIRVGRKTVKIQELIMFCRQMYTLTKAGISLVISVRRLADISRNIYFREVLHNIEKGILAGQAFGACLRRHDDVFSPLFVELVGLGEESGKLDEAFLQIGNYLSLEYDTNKKFKAAIRYPIMVLCAITAAIIIMNIFVIPNFTKLYSSFNTELPLPTKMMIGFSNFLRGNWLFILAGIIIIIVLIRNYIRSPKGKLRWHRMQFKLPLVGSIIERIILSRFSQTMAIVFGSGIPLERGIGLVAGAVGNEYAKERILTMQKRIQNGENLSQAAMGAQLFSPLVLQMVAIGEESGSLETMLQEIHGFYKREIDYDMESLGAKIEPVLLLIVAGMVLMLAIAVFLPMWDIYKFAQGSH